MNCLWRIIAVAATVVATCGLAFGQPAEERVVLIIDLENIVSYWGTQRTPPDCHGNPGPAAAQPPRAFQVNNQSGRL